MLIPVIIYKNLPENIKIEKLTKIVKFLNFLAIQTFEKGAIYVKKFALFSKIIH